MRKEKTKEKSDKDLSDNGAYKKDMLIFVTISPDPSTFNVNSLDDVFRNEDEDIFIGSIRKRWNRLNIHILGCEYYGRIEISKGGLVHAHVICKITKPLIFAYSLSMFKTSHSLNIDYHKITDLSNTLNYISKDNSTFGHIIKYEEMTTLKYPMLNSSLDFQINLCNKKV